MLKLLILPLAQKNLAGMMGLVLWTSSVSRWPKDDFDLRKLMMLQLDENPISEILGFVLWIVSVSRWYGVDICLLETLILPHKQSMHRRPRCCHVLAVETES
jgi:hypothetical protein